MPGIADFLMNSSLNSFMNGPQQAAQGANQNIAGVNRQNAGAYANARNNQSQLDQILAQINGALMLQAPQLQQQLDMAKLNGGNQLNLAQQQGANAMGLSQEQTSRDWGNQSLQNQGTWGTGMLNNEGLKIGNEGQLALSKEKTTRLNDFAGPLFQAISGLFGGGGGGMLSGVQGSGGQSAFLPGTGSGGGNSNPAVMPAPAQPIPPPMQQQAQIAPRPPLAPLPPRSPGTMYPNNRLIQTPSGGTNTHWVY